MAVLEVHAGADLPYHIFEGSRFQHPVFVVCQSRLHDGVDRAGQSDEPQLVDDVPSAQSMLDDA